MRSRGTIENGVLFGDHGELFLAQGGHSVLDMALGRKQVAEKSFLTFEANLQARDAICRSLGCSYVHVLFPDKQSVVKDRFPYPDIISLAALYERRCSSLGQQIFNLTPMLGDETEPVFKRTDTHPNDRGLVLAAASIAGRLTGTDRTEVASAMLGSKLTSRTIAGDLGLRFDPPLQSAEQFVTVDWPVHFFTNDVGFGNDGLVDIYLSPRALHKMRLVWFGDSFGRGCIRFLSRFVSEIVFFRSRFFHEEVARQIKPDAVVTQNVERYLDAVAPDEDAPPFLLYPMLKGLDYKPSQKFASIFAAELSYPRPGYRAAMAEFGMT